ncbi:DUF58 domain-containing protein [Haloterrigena sp. SYSU A121-1]|uniref:DUF58 domain-containing protein n=1 Tax=Haloterrigena gelatinilytica TaxID=2741724 RepID=A0A8J8GH28_9EURY|nr:DUF58 domain-containing protein [Haloterrigena gelatinilytica]NUB89854.1 DUF58 domain-containing protein [Haloterrigena gelatinilytica]
MSRRLRWRGAIAATVVLVLAGLLDASPVLLLAAIVPLVYVAYGSLSTVSVPEGLAAVREVSPTPAAPGRPVTVTLTVRNESDRTVTDCRLVDGVPEELAVLEGSPRAGATLEPGEERRLEYIVVARRGEYEFDAPECRVRGLGASAVATTRLSTAGADRLVCRLDADAPPIEEVGRGRIGQLTTDRPGEGLSFHSVREHRPDDPADRIDWRHYAKRGTLATIDYERQVAATVVLVVDARPSNAVVAGPGRPTAVEFAAYAATRTLTDLLGHGHDAGVAVIGRDGDGPAGLHWIEPASGREQRTRALEVVRSAMADESSSGRFSRTSSGRQDRGKLPRQVRKVLELAPAGAQVALFSPVLDDRSVTAVERWRGGGLPVVVLSPDVVPANTVSGQYEQLRRRTRLARCQALGARTFDWRRGTPLPVLIEHAFTADARLSSARLSGGSGGGGRSGGEAGSEGEFGADSETAPEPESVDSTGSATGESESATAEYAWRSPADDSAGAEREGAVSADGDGASPRRGGDR